MKKVFFIAFLLLALFSSCGEAKVRRYRISVVKEYVHDENSYTQGLFFHDGSLYESTGQYGQSTFRKVDLATGKALRKLDFSRKYFVEGSVMLDGKLYILTWTNRVAFIYDAATLKYEKSVSYPRDGWGLTTDGQNLIASDGSSKLYFLDKNLKTLKTLSVTMDGRPVTYLNELEYIDGRVWANVYTTDLIVAIDPSTGKVDFSVDCTGLLPDRLRDSGTDVLNGIAMNPADGKIYLTGKNWKRIYEVVLKEEKK